MSYNLYSYITHFRFSACFLFLFFLHKCKHYFNNFIFLNNQRQNNETIQFLLVLFFIHTLQTFDEDIRTLTVTNSSEFTNTYSDITLCVIISSNVTIIPHSALTNSLPYSYIIFLQLNPFEFVLFFIFWL